MWNSELNDMFMGTDGSLLSSPRGNIAMAGDAGSSTPILQGTDDRIQSSPRDITMAGDAGSPNEQDFVHEAVTQDGDRVLYEQCLDEHDVETAIQDIVKIGMIDAHTASLLNPTEILCRYSSLKNALDANKEKAWKKFYDMMKEENFKDITVIPKRIKRFLALKLFNIILDKQDLKVVSCGNTMSFVVLDREKDILCYVGGYILKELSKKHYADCLQVLKADATSNVVNVQVLNRSQNRGGLTFISEFFLSMLVNFENTFNKLYQFKKDDIHKEQFVMKCNCDFFKLFSRSFCGYSIEQVQLIFNDICSLFFTTRIHHHAKVMSEVSKGNKGLRKSLKSLS